MMSAMSGQNISFMEHCGKLHKKKTKIWRKNSCTYDVVPYVRATGLPFVPTLLTFC